MILESISIIGFAILIDLIFGDPKNRYHPTAWMGILIAKFTPLAKNNNPTFEKIGGILIVIIIQSLHINVGGVKINVEVHLGLNTCSCL